MKKSDKLKEILLDQLHKTPIIEAACQKAGISRMTFYRWKEKDPEFTKKVEEALQEGRLLVNDLAESQLISAVKDRNLSAITYWLKHHHPSYTTRVEISGSLRQLREELTDEEAEMIADALKLAGYSEQQINLRDQIIQNDHEHREPRLSDRTDQAQPPVET